MPIKMIVLLAPEAAAAENFWVGRSAVELYAATILLGNELRSPEKQAESQNAHYRRTTPAPKHIGRPEATAALPEI